MLFSTAGKRLYWPPKPKMFQGSTIAPHSMAVCSRCSTGGNCAGRLGQIAAVDGQVPGGQAATHFAGHAGRGRRHHRRLPRRRLGVADRREQLRHVDVLQLLGPAPRQVLVEVLPRAAERLPQRQRLGTQPLGVRTASACPAARS